MELRLFWGPFCLLQLVLVKNGLLVGVHRWSCYHVAARVAPGRTGELFEWRLDGGRLLLLLLLLRLKGRLRLCKVLLGRLVVIWGSGCRSVASWIIRVVNACRWKHESQQWGHKYIEEDTKECSRELQANETYKCQGYSENVLILSRLSRLPLLPINHKLAI